ncbi:hypothetical protein [Streptomyces sp. NPDC046805]|uniref:hypothetical protein n=1 Tax=Streptomyces sp. NPDC046805 TaxID=3155134 RepID=UPI0033E589BA
MRIDGEIGTVVATEPTVEDTDLVVRRSDGTFSDVVLSHAELRAATDAGSLELRKVAVFSVVAAAATLRRWAEALKGPVSGRGG